MGIGEILYGRFVRLSALRAAALGALGAMALAVPGFAEEGLAWGLLGYLVANGSIWLVEACAFDRGPHTPANRVALVAACLLFGLAALAGLVLPHLERARVLLYGHTHEAACEFQHGMWVVNPGSIGSLARPTYAVAVLEAGGAVCYISTT